MDLSSFPFEKMKSLVLDAEDLLEPIYPVFYRLGTEPQQHLEWGLVGKDWILDFRDPEFPDLICRGRSDSPENAFLDWRNNLPVYFQRRSMKLKET